MTNLLLLVLCIYPLSLHTPRLPVFRSFSYYGLPSDHSLLDGSGFLTSYGGLWVRSIMEYLQILCCISNGDDQVFFQLHPTLCLLSILVHGSFHIYYYQTMSLPFYFLILIFGLFLSWFNIFFKFFLNPLLKHSGKAFLSPWNRLGAPVPPQLPRILWIPLFL